MSLSNVNHNSNSPIISKHLFEGGVMPAVVCQQSQYNKHLLWKALAYKRLSGHQPREENSVVVLIMVVVVAVAGKVEVVVK